MSSHARPNKRPRLWAWSWWDGVKGRASIAGSLVRFFWAYRLWWLIPMVMVLLLFGVLLILAQQTVVAPFIYTLF